MVSSSATVPPWVRQTVQAYVTKGQAPIFRVIDTPPGQLVPPGHSSGACLNFANSSVRAFTTFFKVDVLQAAACGFHEPLRGDSGVGVFPGCLFCWFAHPSFLVHSYLLWISRK